MAEVLKWLASNSYILLFTVVLGALLLGKVTIKGFSLGTVASAIIVGAALSALATRAGVKIGIDGFTKSIFYCLFMYAVGLRIGPSLIHCLKGDGLRFTLLAVACSLIGLLGVVALANLWDLPAGAAGGILAGSMTMPGAIGSAEQAVSQGAFPLPAGRRPEDVSGMIALCFGLTYLWGTVGIVLVCRYLPRWWGVDPRAEARKYEEVNGVPNVDDAGLTAYRPLFVRAYRLTNETLTGWTVRQFALKYPQYKVLNVLRGEPARRGPIETVARAFSMEDEPAFAAAGVRSMTVLHEQDTTPPGRARPDRGLLPATTYAKLGAPDGLALRQGDIVTLGGRYEAMTANTSFIGPEVSDPTALNVPIDAAEIVVTSRELEGRELAELRSADFSGQVAIRRIERGGVPIPLGLHLKLQRFDVLFVAGVKSGIERLAALAGRVAHPSTSTDILTLAAGMILGLLLGQVEVRIADANVGLGNAGGLLLSGVIVSSLAWRMRIFESTPSAARNVLEDLGLVMFIAIVGISAGASLVTHLSRVLALKILVAGFVASTVPPILAWTIGHHGMKINPAILMGAIAGARSHLGAARDAARELDGSVPWIGFPVAYAVSALLLTLFGYVAMILTR